MAPATICGLETRRWVYGLLELLVSIFLFALGVGVDGRMPRVGNILERDPALSAPYLGNTISTGQLVAIAYAAPLVIMIALVFAVGLRKGRSARDCLAQAFYACAGLQLSFAISFCATNTIKIAVGRPRPNAFSMCDYAGYRAAADAGGIGVSTPAATAYLAATTAGAFADMMGKCGDADGLKEALRSFPSGHSSAAFCGLLYFTLFLRWITRVRKGTWASPGALLCASPLIVAAYVCLTRIFDRWHNFDDISVGAAVGAIAAGMAWSHFRGHAAQRDLLFRAEDVRAAAAAEAGGEGKSAPSEARTAGLELRSAAAAPARPDAESVSGGAPEAA